jgi:hypothetical protein
MIPVGTTKTKVSAKDFLYLLIYFIEPLLQNNITRMYFVHKFELEIFLHVIMPLIKPCTKYNILSHSRNAQDDVDL